MTILRMHANFGCLENATLDLSAGLNILTLPNESGKSTWAQFLLAMFYGIDTAERAKTGLIPTKTKYKPWSGTPMSGSIELAWNGRTLILERTTRGRVPMGQFRAYEKDSGAPVSELTAENCGQTLLGVERSVFERSAFVRQLGLFVSSDDALERRLSSLVTTGEETVSASETARRLRERKNRLRHNKTGLIPETAARLDAVSATLARIASATAEHQSLRAHLEETEAQIAELQRVKTALDILSDHQKLQQKYDAKAALIDANNRLQGAKARVARLPEEDALSALLSRIRAADALTIPPAPPAPPPAPSCPAAFRGVPDEELMERAARDGREFDRLTAIRRRPAGLCAAAAVIFAVLSVLGVLLSAELALTLFGAGLSAAAWVVFAVYLRQNRRYAVQMDEADALLTRYGRHSRDEFSTLAANYRESRSTWHRTCEDLARSEAQRQQLLDEKSRLTAACLGSAAMLAPDVRTLADAETAVSAALAAYETLHAAKHTAEQATLRYDAVSAALAGIAERPLPAGDYSAYTLPAVQAELLRLDMARTALQSRLDQERGRLASLGDSAALAAEQEQLAGQLSALQTRYAALELAEQTLQNAAATLQSRFAPALTQEGSRIFSALTDGRYDRMRIDRQLSLETGLAGEPALHEGGYCSAGTQDALYLALRLAVARLALPAETPLILDDALVCFDDARLARALSLLQQEAATRQILLFTCQHREALALQPEKSGVVPFCNL